MDVLSVIFKFDKQPINPVIKVINENPEQGDLFEMKYLQQSHSNP